MSRRFLLTPELMVRLVTLLTPQEDEELFAYASANGGPESRDFAYRASEWIIRRFNLTPGIPANTPDDAVLVMKRILPREHE